MRPLVFSSLVVTALGFVSSPGVDAEPPPPAVAAIRRRDPPPDRPDTTPSRFFTESDQQSEQELWAASDHFSAYVSVMFRAPSTENSISPGAALLAQWMARRGEWKDVVDPKGKRINLKHVKKDVWHFRGERTCVSGYVAQIREFDLGRFPTFEGILWTEQSPVHFIASGSTGGIYEDSATTFCGITLALYSYDNVSGGQSQAVQMIGMFDLPANHKPHPGSRF